MTQSIQHAKFTLEKWGSIEVNLDDFSLLVLETLRPLGLKNKMTTKGPKGKVPEATKTADTTQVCGDAVYRTVIRPRLEEDGIVLGKLADPSQSKDKKVSKKGGNKKKKPGKKTADEIREQNTMKKTKVAVESTLETIKKYTKPDYGFSSHFAEIKLLTLMFVASRLCKRKDLPTASIYEIIIGAMKARQGAASLQGISESALEDVDRWITFMKDTVHYSPRKVFYSFPRLVLSTKYDQIFPKTAVKPYRSQVELMDHVLGNDAALIFYNAMIGAGKTTSVVPIAAFCQTLREQQRLQKGKGKKSKGFLKQVIFCCSVEPVRYQVANLAYNAKIPFGIATVDSKGYFKDKVRIRNHFSCSEETSRELIVSDLLSTLRILKESDDYILFLDEPTVAADLADHALTQMVVDVLAEAPPMTILSSATMPSPDEVPKLTTLFQERHKGAKIINMHSREALIGCEIITSSNSTLSPHTGCESLPDLKRIIEVIESNPFLGRLYTAPIVYRLSERLQELNVPNLPDLEETFRSVTSLSQIRIQETALKLLRCLEASGSDALITKACTPMESGIADESDPDFEAIVMSDEDTAPEHELGEHEGDGDLFEEDESNIWGANVLDLFTTSAHKYLGGCLAAVASPLEFARVCARVLLGRVRSFQRDLRAYRVEVEKFDQTIEKMRHSIRNPDELSIAIQDMNENSRPKLIFDDSLQINTKEHLRRFTDAKTVQKIDKRFLRAPLILETLPIDELHVPEWVLALLFCGVGVYDPEHPSLSPRYLELVLEMTAKSQLSMIIADDSISYGANYPISHVLIDDALSEKRSMRTLFQLMGRAGRVGMSWTAKVHLLGPQLEEKLLDYVHGKYLNETSIEAKNLEIAVDRTKE